MEESNALPVATDPLIGLILLLEWPLTKASYVEALAWPEDVEFPLDAEVEAQVPDELPGKLPTSQADLSATA